MSTLPKNRGGEVDARRTALELFAGAGGSALGLHRAGWRAVGYVEKNKHAAATLRAAVGLGLLEPGKVIEDRVEAVDYTRGRGQVGLVWSSFPCPGYSAAGRGLGMDDPRDGWVATLRAIDQVEPAWFAGENVDLVGRHPEAAEIIDRSLLARFRAVSSWVLNAADFGVPQRRLRRFWVAGPVEVPQPAPTGPGATLMEALEYDPWERLVWSEDYEDWWCSVCNQHAGYCDCPGPLDAETILSRHAPTLTGGSEQGHVGSRSVLSADAEVRWRLWTALSRHRGGLTIPEAAILQGFPVDWPFQGGKQAQLRQVANAVPPPVAEAVGAAILEA